MDHLLEQLNAPILYALVGGAILLVVAMCVTFMVKSWRAGLRLGMDRAVLKKTVISSATFTLLPAFSILLGVIALSGSLGIPLPWLRLSVIGNLQYEVNVAEIAATGIGLSGLKISELTPQAYVTIALVMTCGILGGALLCLFTLKAYSKKLRGNKAQKPGEAKASFGDWAMAQLISAAMWVRQLRQAGCRCSRHWWLLQPWLCANGLREKSKHIGWKTLPWQPACWWLWLLPWVSMRCCKGGYEDGNATPFDHRGGKAALV